MSYTNNQPTNLNEGAIPRSEGTNPQLPNQSIPAPAELDSNRAPVDGVTTPNEDINWNELTFEDSTENYDSSYQGNSNDSQGYKFDRLREKIQDPEVLREIENYENGVNKLASKVSQYEQAIQEYDKAYVALVNDVQPLAEALQTRDLGMALSYLQQLGFDLSPLDPGQNGANATVANPYQANQYDSYNPKLSELERKLQQTEEYVRAQQAREAENRFLSNQGVKAAEFVKKATGWEVTPKMMLEVAKRYPQAKGPQVVEALKRTFPDEYIAFKTGAHTGNLQAGSNRPFNSTTVNPFDKATNPMKYYQWEFENKNNNKGN